jgi:hypothetical protein
MSRQAVGFFVYPVIVNDSFNQTRRSIAELKHTNDATH